MKSINRVIILLTVIGIMILSLASLASSKSDNRMPGRFGINPNDTSLHTEIDNDSSAPLSTIQIIFIIILVLALVCPCIWGVYITCHIWYKDCWKNFWKRRVFDNTPRSSGFYAQTLSDSSDDDPFAYLRYSAMNRDDSIV